MQPSGHVSTADQARAKSIAVRQRQHVQRTVALRGPSARLSVVGRLELPTVRAGRAPGLQQEPALLDRARGVLVPQRLYCQRQEQQILGKSDHCQHQRFNKCTVNRT